MNISSAIRQSITTVRNDRQERREARARYEALKTELASYQSEREVDDLLGTVEHQDGRDAEQIRSILLDNLRPALGLGRIG